MRTIWVVLQLDIEGLSITVTSSNAATSSEGTPVAAKGRGKGKAKSEGTEILSGAKLRLKEGQRYALVGRNGSGKSSESLTLSPPPRAAAVRP